jgi:ABC-type nitrate/sulfonate/bicarbonate transport system substrate-binding protein
MRRRPALAAVLVALLALLGPACGSTSAGPPGAPAPAPAQPKAAAGQASGRPLYPLKISYAAAAVADLPFYAAESAGLFAQQGLSVSMVRMAPNVAIAALAKGEIQFMNSPGDAIEGAARGFPFRVVYSAWDQSPWVLVGRAELRSMADVRGHTLGTNIPGSTPYAYLQAGLDKAGLKVSDVKILTFHGTNAVYSALLSGQIEAGVLSPPYDVEAETKGFHRVAFLGGDLQVPYIGLGTTTAFIRDHRPQVVAAVRALWEAGRWIRAHPDQSVDLIAKNVGVTPDVARRAYEATVPLLTRTGETTELGVRQNLDLIGQALKKPVRLDPGAVVDFGPLREALAAAR